MTRYLYWVGAFVLLAAVGYLGYYYGSARPAPQTSTPAVENTGDQNQSTLPYQNQLGDSSFSNDLGGFKVPPNTSQPQPTNPVTPGTPTTQVGWATYTSNNLGIAFNYPLQTTWYNGPTESVAITEEPNQVVIGVAGTDGYVAKYCLTRDNKPANQDAAEFVQQEYESQCDPEFCPSINVVTHTNPADPTDFVSLTLGHDYPPAIYDIVDTIIFY